LYSGSGKYDIDYGDLKKLADMARDIENCDYPTWVNLLQIIGNDLTKRIISANGTFSMHCWQAIGHAKGIENARLRFTTGRDVHPIALEALMVPDEEESGFWMLKSPVIRRLSAEGRRWPLFEDEGTRSGPLNCLIIEADTEGYVPGLKRLKKLENVTEECRWLRSFLAGDEEEKPRFAFERVEHVRAAELPAGRSFKQHVKKRLTDGPCWHVVHYGGHSQYDQAEGRGYVFFPGRTIAKVDIKEFATWLNRAEARFVFLSSCHSSEADIAFELAHNRVPAILGFRWDVDDDKAEEHAKIFYTELLGGPCARPLEEALLRARQEMHGRFQSNRIWAAPMMIMQAAA
jgi:hypothetical protein